MVFAALSFQGVSLSTRRVRRGRLAPPLLTWCLITLAIVGGVLAAVRTAQGHDIVIAVQRFLLYYVGVFALLALTAAVVVGLAVTDRILMTPGSRVVGQVMHRVLSLAALAALATHIVLEIVAHRAAAIDGLVPFLAHGRTFYVGLGTLGSDLIVAIVATSIIRGRLTARPRAWRAVHVTAYLAWLLSIVHGLLAGRTAQPYVDWSYGAMRCRRRHGAGDQDRRGAPGAGAAHAAAGAGPAGDAHARRDHARRPGPAGAPSAAGHQRAGCRVPAVTATSAPEALYVGQPRLTSGLDRMASIDAPAFEAVFGKLPHRTSAELIAMAQQVDLRGRGGAAFPVARKLAAVARSARDRGKKPVILVNATEGEPGSAKDRMLLLRTPYLVLGGALIAARALRTAEILVAVTERGTRKLAAHRGPSIAAAAAARSGRAGA